MIVKETRKLFMGNYRYKVVLIVAGASLFRHGNMDTTLVSLKTTNLNDLITGSWRHPKFLRTKEDLDRAIKLCEVMSTLSDIELRVESPWISIYTNTKDNVDKLTYEPSMVKYISVPADNSSLTTGVIVMPKIDFDYKVTLGRSSTDHLAFVDWAKNNTKLKLTKSCVTELSRQRSWGGTYFYVKGENNLLMAKMHLGGAIAKVERIFKA